MTFIFNIYLIGSLICGVIMGFLISKEGLVEVDHNVKNFGNTLIKGNPTESITRCYHNPMKIYSIFLRQKSYTANLGDNCPLIYALKRKRGLYVTKDSIGSLCLHIYEIMMLFFKGRLSEGTLYDLIIPMPSSHKISYYLAKRISELFTNSCVVSDFFRKASCEDVLKQINTDQGTPHNAKVNIINAINSAKKSGSNFSIGDVNTKFRKYVAPLAFKGGDFHDKKVLLIDDLFATGSTIISAKNYIHSASDVLKVDGLCLFSPLNGRIKK